MKSPAVPLPRPPEALPVDPAAARLAALRTAPVVPTMLRLALPTHRHDLRANARHTGAAGRFGVQALAAWLSTRGSAGRGLALVWNGFGLLALANIVTRAVGTAPGPPHVLHTEVPNRMIGTYPFMFIPGFFVPSAVVLHVLALRAIIGLPRTGSE